MGVWGQGILVSLVGPCSALRGPSGHPLTMDDCIFCRIVAGEMATDFIREDTWTVAFRDLHPQAPSHVLVIPRQHVPSLWELDDGELAGRILSAAAAVARQEGLESGWRLIVNTRSDGGQEVDHLHLHVIGGRPLGPMLSSSRNAKGA